MSSTNAQRWEMVRTDAIQAVQHGWLTTLGGSPFLLRPLRRWVYRLAGAHVDSAPGARFTMTGSARNLTIARGTYLNQEVFIEAVAPVTIGSGVAIGMQAMIVTSTHPVGPDDRWQRDAGGEAVEIGDDCWIGARAVVLPGVRIAAGSVIAAGAVVTKDCLVPGVYAGVPARLLRELHPGESGLSAQLSAASSSP